MKYEIIDEPDEMRATDRLVNRIQQRQQQKLIVREIFLMVILISLFINIISDIFLTTFIYGIPETSSIININIILVISTILSIILCYYLVHTYNEYNKGSIETHIPYNITIQNKINDVEKFVKWIWHEINPLNTWEFGSATVLTSDINILTFININIDESRNKFEENEFNIHLTGNWVYKDITTIPNKINAKSSFKLHISGKQLYDKFYLSFFINLKVQDPITPSSDELIQDVAVIIRSLKNTLYHTLSSTNPGNIIF